MMKNYDESVEINHNLYFQKGCTKEKKDMIMHRNYIMII